MTRMVTMLAAVAGFLCLASPARAQVSYGGCFVGGGYQVPSVASTQVNDIAIASRLPDGSPVIYYNPAVIASVTPQTRLFFYYHECAHHVLGHLMGTTHPLAVEQQADCWAIRNIAARNLFSAYDMRVVQEELTRYAQGDWSHLPGRQRAINLEYCLS